MSNQHVKSTDPQNKRNAQIFQLSFELLFTSNQCAEMYALISSASLLQKQFSDEKISSKNTNERCQAQHIRRMQHGGCHALPQNEPGIS